MDKGSKYGMFPLFLSLEGKTCVVIGGGKIAQRRIETLLSFGCRLKVISPQLTPKLQKLAEANAFSWEARPYREGDFTGAFLAVAATDVREVNHQAAVFCRQEGIFISVADCVEECTFQFPAVVRKPPLVIGLNSGGTDHALVKKTAAFLRTRLEGWVGEKGEKDEENTNRKP